MKIAITGGINAKQLLDAAGVGEQGRKIRPLLINECMKAMDKYVPMETGVTKNTAQAVSDGIIYKGPHTRYIYHGKNMRTPSGSTWAQKGERKHLTDEPIRYHGEPLRGPYWDVRMWTAEGHDICERLAKHIGGKTE